MTLDDAIKQHFETLARKKAELESLQRQHADHLREIRQQCIAILDGKGTRPSKAGNADPGDNLFPPADEISDSPSRKRNPRRPRKVVDTAEPDRQNLI